jgi:type II secretory pathway pseudopilin PulG
MFYPNTFMTKTATTHRHRGISLIENLIASTILATASLTVTYAVVAGQQQARASEERLHAVDLAEDLIDEILRQPYLDPNGDSELGPETGENTRADYDNADDYHDFLEDAGALQDALGVTYPPEYQAFFRRVTIIESTQSVSGLDDIDGIIVRVRVNDAAGTTPEALIVRFIPEYAP